MRLDETQKSKIARFINDRLMADAVYQVILDTFLKEKSTDVHALAAERLAINLLRKSWKELEVMKSSQEEKVETPRQIGM